MHDTRAQQMYYSVIADQWSQTNEAGMPLHLSDKLSAPNMQTNSVCLAQYLIHTNV